VNDNPATDRNSFSRHLPKSVLLTPAQTKQVAGGCGIPDNTTDYQEAIKWCAEHEEECVCTDM